jgi:hypothetical protein
MVYTWGRRLNILQPPLIEKDDLAVFTIQDKASSMLVAIL